MIIKTRLLKLEKNHAAQARQQVMHENGEDSRQWLHDTIQSINERRRLSDEGMIEDTDTPSPKKPLFPNVTLTKLWLDNLITEIELRHEH